MLYLLHIPKTGGQTLATRLASAFPPGRTSIMQADIHGAEELAALAASFDFFEGHPAGSVLAKRPAGLKVISAVRDPVEQVISHYRHILRAPALPLHKAAQALPPTAFMDRFSHVMFNFQSRCLIRAFHGASPQERIRGEELWLLRHLEAVAEQVDRLLPTERIDEFCLLWSLETGRALRGTEARINEGRSDEVDMEALRAWLRARPERFAVDSLLWQLAQRRYAEWRERLLGADRTSGEPAPATLAWSEGEAAIWLTRDWHPPARRADGVTEWWAGPGFAPEIRLRPAGRRLLRFEALTFLGVRWDRIRLLRRPDLAAMRIAGKPDPAAKVVRFEAELPADARGVELCLFSPEDTQVLPPVPLAFQVPRRGFATQNWGLA
jgi:hypothetical protein